MAGILPEGATHMMLRQISLGSVGISRDFRYARRGKNGQWVVWDGKRWQGADVEFKFHTDVVKLEPKKQTYWDVKDEIVYIPSKDKVKQLFRVVGYSKEDDFLVLRYLGGKDRDRGKTISGIHPHQVALWHEIGGE